MNVKKKKKNTIWYPTQTRRAYEEYVIELNPNAKQCTQIDCTEMYIVYNIIILKYVIGLWRF